MTTLAHRLANLSPEQRRRLNSLLAREHTVPAKKIDAAITYPLSFAQQRLWVLNAIQENEAAYLVPGALRLTGPVDVAALRHCLETIVDRHAVLRTVFEIIDGEARQRILELHDVSIALPIVVLGTLNASERESEARARIADEMLRPFDLSKAPLLRVLIIDMGCATAQDEHIIAFAMHHIISDGWSAQALVREFAALYDARLSGRDAELPLLPVQYVDYALWQREWLSGDRLERQLAWWREALKEANFTLDLPKDRVRPPTQDNAGRTIQFDVSTRLAMALRALARENGVTPYMVLLAAYFILLARWSGQTDICVGTPVANRRRLDHEPLIGFFVNTLVLRGDLSGDPTFLDFLSRVKAFCLGAQDNQDLPFERLVEDLAPARDLSRTPLFQTMFSLQKEPIDELALHGMAIEPFEIDFGVAKFDLSFDLVEAADGRVKGEAEYATALFDASTIERMIAHFVQLLGSIVEAPSARLGKLVMLAPDERDLLLYGVNKTDTPFSYVSVVGLFAARAHCSPNSIAVCGNGRSLSYGDLDRQSNRLARELIARGAGPERIIGICLDRSVEMIVALIAILKSGAAYLPLDPDYPEARLFDMIADAEPLLTLASATTATRLPGVRQLCVDDAATASALRAHSVTALDRPVLAQSTAYVIYTSGSTGGPKGVIISHASLANLLRCHIVDYGLSAVDRVLQLASPSFDLSVEEIFPALCVGATLILAPGQFAGSWSAFHELIHSNAITFVSAPTAVWRHYTHWLAENRVTAPMSMRRLTTGTEAADAATLRLWLECAPHAQWGNAYGPTETTVTATTWHLTQDPMALTDVPIGMPLANVRVYVLDRWMQPSPFDVVGEIYIGGVGVARGYLNRSDLTAERFVPDPYGPAGARLYRTGDLGRRRADGQIIFCGRADAQVKIRGYRVETGEVERVLAHLSNVRAAAVIACDDLRGDKRLVAFVAVDDMTAFDSEKARVELRSTLPEYMIPASVIARAALPLNANGKIDKASLLAEGLDLDATHYVAPRNSTEATICLVFAEVLGLQRLGVTDNFFEAGGHSLLALRAVDAMRRAGLSAEARTIFKAPTPEQLARALDDTPVRAAPEIGIPPDCRTLTPQMISLATLTEDEIERLVAATPGGAPNIKDIYPLSPLQEGILFHHLMMAGSDPYLSPMQFAFESRKKLDAFVLALRTLVKRHDVLRTAIVYENLAEPLQVVLREAPFDVNELPPMTALAMRDRFRVELCRIDIRVAPLMQISVAQDPENRRWLLLLLVHHLVLDHVTAERMLGELKSCLAGREAAESAAPYRNFVAQTRSYRSQAEHQAFFAKMLGDFVEPTIPLGLSDVRGDGSVHVAAVLPIGEALSRRLRDAARKLGVSPASIFHVAYARLLGRLSGRDDVVFGTVLFGRMNDATANGLGMYINTLPFRLKLNGVDAQGAVAQTQSALTSLLSHEHGSLALAQRCSGVQQPAPLFVALFNYRHSADDGAGVDADVALAEGTELIFAEERSNYPFDLSIDDFGDRFSIEMQSSPEIDPHRVCGQMQTIVEGLVEALELAPDRPILDLDILSVDERTQLLQEFATNDIHFARSVSVVELFNMQLRRCPNAIALVCDGETLDYRELDQRANRLARLLMSRGAGPERLIGLCVGRSIDMIVSLLAILKSGSGYLPLDPDYPPARLNFMIEEAQPLAVVASGALAGRFSEATPLLIPESPETIKEIAAHSDAALPFRVSSENIAYVIYTSGSTGTPKGVVISHENLANLTQGQIAFYGFSGSDRILQLASIGFDMSVEEIFPALCSGATLVLAPGRFVEAWSKFQSLITDNAVTFINPSTAVWRHYTQWLAETGAHPPASLRTLSTGGETVDSATLRLWRDLAADVAFVNGYGPTETSVNASAWRLEEDVNALVDVPIGQPVANARLLLLDRRLDPVPIGVVGELYVGGAGVARGYLGRTDQTAEKFVPDPYGPAGSRIYRTGDLARRQADGALIFAGRIDSQVKVRGFRIELSEIEAALRQLATIRDAVVVERDAAGGSRIVAFVVPDKLDAFDADVARAALRDVVPEYMIPAAIVALPQLPLNTSGKIDRKALPELEVGQRAVEFSPPETETERALCDAWSKSLGIERVSAHANFFELGGHSLAVMQMAARLSQTLAMSIPLALVYQTETLRELAGAIDAAAALRAIAAAEATCEEFEEFEI